MTLSTTTGEREVVRDVEQSSPQRNVSPSMVKTSSTGGVHLGQDRPCPSPKRKRWCRNTPTFCATDWEKPRLGRFHGASSQEVVDNKARQRAAGDWDSQRSAAFDQLTSVRQNVADPINRLFDPRVA